MTESVTVAGEGPLLKTDRADVATTFESEAAHRAARARPELHEVRAADAGRPAADLAARREREPAGVDPDMVNGQHFSGTGYQLDGTENRDPILGHHRDQPEPGVDRREQGHVAELRGRVRPGDGGRRLGADQVRHERDPWQRLRFGQRRQVPGPQPLHAAGPEPVTGKVLPETKPEPVRRLDRRPDRQEQVVLLRRLPGLAQHGGRLEAADRADGRRAHRQPQRRMASTSSTRSPAPSRPRARSSRATSSRRAGCRPQAPPS